MRGYLIAIISPCCYFTRNFTIRDKYLGNLGFDAALILLLIWLGRMFSRASVFQCLVRVIQSPTFLGSLIICLVLSSMLLSRGLHGSLSSNGHSKTLYMSIYPWSIKTLSNQDYFHTIEAVLFLFFILFWPENNLYYSL